MKVGGLFFLGFILTITIILSVYAIKTSSNDVIKLYKKSNDVKDDFDSQSLICEIRKVTDPGLKAKIFVTLMCIGYVLIHKQTNEGNKHNDEKQELRFARAMKAETINAINSIEGKEIC